MTIKRLSFDLNNLKKWKASEIRNFFLYLSIPVLKDFLLPKYLWNLSCLVYGN